MKALLVGINAYERIPLRGCLNDVANVHAVLRDRYDLADDDVRILRDADATKAAIQDNLRWLATAEDGDSATRLFHYSGHGKFVLDKDGDEPDGRDEALVPHDYDTAGELTDDELRKAYREFGRGTHLVLLMDCCHSGTISRDPVEDVVYRFMPSTRAEENQFDAAARAVNEQRYQAVLSEVRDISRTSADDDWEQRVRQAMARYDKRHFGLDKLRGNVVLLAACRSDQTAADARVGGQFVGPFSYYLTEALSQGGQRLTYHALIEEVGHKLGANDFSQIPQLESNTANQECAFLNVEL